MCVLDGMSQKRCASLSMVIALTGSYNTTNEEEEVRRGLWLISQDYERHATKIVTASRSQPIVNAYYGSFIEVGLHSDEYREYHEAQGMYRTQICKLARSNRQHLHIL